MAKCNLTPEERKRVLEAGDFGNICEEDRERCREIFEHYLFVDTYGEKNYRWSKCSYCQSVTEHYRERERDFFKIHHGETYRCPVCGKMLTVEFYGKLGKGLQLHQTAAVSFVNIKDGALLIDSGIAFWDYYEDGDYVDGLYPHGDMDISFAAKKRYYINTGKIQGWKRSLYFGYKMYFYVCRATEWEPMVNICEPFQSNPMYGFDGSGFYIGLERVRESNLKYCAIDKYYMDWLKIEDIAEETQPMTAVTKYLAEAALHPQVEMAVKLGMCEAVAQLIDGRKNARELDWKARNPAAFLRLDKQNARLFIDKYCDGSCEGIIDTLRFVHSGQKHGQSVKRLIDYADKITSKGVERISPICSKYSLPIAKAVNYLGCYVNAAEWADYVSMAEQLGYDLTEQTVLMPKNLRERHDAASALMKAKSNEVKQKAYRGRYIELCKKYSFTLDGLSVIVPESAEEIVKEGKTLHHCVGGYAERHMDGKTTILFIRKERTPERSFLTVELDDKGAIRQIHGYQNERYPHSIPPARRYSDWLETWQSWYRHGSKRYASGSPILKERRKTA